MRQALGNGIPWQGSKLLFNGATDPSADTVRYYTLYGRKLGVTNAQYTVLLNEHVIMDQFVSGDPGVIQICNRLPVSGSATQLSAACNAFSMLYGFVEFDAVVAETGLSTFQPSRPVAPFATPVFSNTDTAPVTIQASSDTIDAVFAVTLQLVLDTAAAVSLTLTIRDDEFTLDFTQDTSGVGIALFDQIPMQGASISIAVSTGTAFLYGYTQPLPGSSVFDFPPTAPTPFTNVPVDFVLFIASPDEPAYEAALAASLIDYMNILANGQSLDLTDLYDVLSGVGGGDLNAFDAPVQPSLAAPITVSGPTQRLTLGGINFQAA